MKTIDKNITRLEINKHKIINVTYDESLLTHEIINNTKYDILTCDIGSIQINSNNLIKVDLTDKFFEKYVPDEFQKLQNYKLQLQEYENKKSQIQNSTDNSTDSMTNNSTDEKTKNTNDDSNDAIIDSRTTRRSERRSERRNDYSTLSERNESTIQNSERKRLEREQRRRERGERRERRSRLASEVKEINELEETKNEMKDEKNQNNNNNLNNNNANVLVKPKEPKYTNIVYERLIIEDEINAMTKISKTKAVNKTQMKTKMKQSEKQNVEKIVQTAILISDN